jgi:hypothetical protein
MNPQTPSETAPDTHPRAGARVGHVVRLDLTDFRNYAGLRIDVDARPVLLATFPDAPGA